MTQPLPAFPVDDMTLDLLYASTQPDVGADRSSLMATLDMLSIQAGSDPDAVEEHISDNIKIMRDAFYSPHDAIRALIEEIRRLRGGD